MTPIQLIPRNTKINFMGFRYVTFLIAAIVIIATTVSLFTKGLNYGVDFRGGFILDVRMSKEPNLPKLRAELDNLKLGEVVLQEFGAKTDLMIKIERQEGDDTAQKEALGKIKSALEKHDGGKVDYRKVETVGPKVGDELVKNSLKAIALALAAMLVYIAVRFEWQFAVCAVIALFHDCMAILGMFTLLPFDFNETAIIAILITAGYSINDTIVIFDRIRENLHESTEDMATIINKSLNETLSRTVLTATTTLLALLALYFFGGKVISSFSLPIIVGILIGSFSSICLAAPLLSYLGLNKNTEEEANLI